MNSLKNRLLSVKFYGSTNIYLSSRHNPQYSIVSNDIKLHLVLFSLSKSSAVLQNQKHNKNWRIIEPTAAFELNASNTYRLVINEVPILNKNYANVCQSKKIIRSTPGNGFRNKVNI